MELEAEWVLMNTFDGLNYLKWLATSIHDHQNQQKTHLCSLNEENAT